MLEQPTGRHGRAVAYWRQAGRVVTAVTGMGLTVSEVVAEVGSGLEHLSAALEANGRRSASRRAKAALHAARDAA